MCSAKGIILANTPPFSNDFRCKFEYFCFRVAKKGSWSWTSQIQPTCWDRERLAGCPQHQCLLFFWLSLHVCSDHYISWKRLTAPYYLETNWTAGHGFCTKPIQRNHSWFLLFYQILLNFSLCGLWMLPGYTFQYVRILAKVVGMDSEWVWHWSVHHSQ